MAQSNRTTAIWSATKTGGKAGFDKLWKWTDKLGAPVNKLSNKLGAEAFWPTTLDKESDKAARILKSFCKDGFYTEDEVVPVDGPKQKQRVLKKIPAEVIRNAKGLAIFTTMRTGLWFSGAGGSGILVARLPDGSWSPPSGLMLHTAGLGFLVGVDIYDCVMVINTEEALQGFSKLRCTVGGEMSAVAGPVGIGGVLDSEVHMRRSPIFTYMKSRGFYAGVQIDGTILIERTDENARFYRQSVSVKDIIAGKIRHPPLEVNTLMQTIKAAQGDTDVDESQLPTEPSPSDFEIVDIVKKDTFGVPDKDDPDPYGVLALQHQGMLIREAGSTLPAPIDQFAFDPLPTSPVYSTFNRGSIDARTVSSRRNSWRASVFSSTGMTDASTQTADMATQTDFSETPATSPALSMTRRLSEIVNETPRKAGPPALPPRATTPVLLTPTTIHVAMATPLPPSPTESIPPVPQAPATPTIEVRPVTPVARTPSPVRAVRAQEIVVEDDSDVEDDDEDDEDYQVEIVEPVMQTVARASSPQRNAVNKIRVVTVAGKPAPPPLPVRSQRRRTALMSDASGSTETTEQETTTTSSPASNIDIPASQLAVPTTTVTAPSISAAMSELRMLHRRSSSVSTYRERESGHRSDDEESVSSVEEMTGLERHLAAARNNQPSTSTATEEAGLGAEKDDDLFHSAAATPASEAANKFEDVSLKA